MTLTTSKANTKSNVEAKISALSGSEPIDELLILVKAAAGRGCDNYGDLETAVATRINSQNSSTPDEDILLGNVILQGEDNRSLSGVPLNGVLGYSDDRPHIVLPDGTELLHSNTRIAGLAPDEYPNVTRSFLRINDTVRGITGFPNNVISMVYYDGFFYLITSNTLYRYSVSGNTVSNSGLTKSLSSYNGSSISGAALLILVEEPITKTPYLWVFNSNRAYKYNIDFTEVGHDPNEYVMEDAVKFADVSPTSIKFSTSQGNTYLYDYDMNKLDNVESVSYRSNIAGVTYIKGVTVSKYVSGDLFEVWKENGEGLELVYVFPESNNTYADDAGVLINIDGDIGSFSISRRTLYIFEVDTAIGIGNFTFTNGIPTYLRIK